MTDQNQKNPSSGIRRYSSRRQPLEQSFLCQYLQGAKAYDRIAGYFCSSILEVAGEALDSIYGRIRMVCNSDIRVKDLETARAAQTAVRQSWCASELNNLLRFMYGIAERARSLLLATATLVQIRPVEAWDLMDIFKPG